MNFSAASSSSPVVTPGRALPRSSRWQRASIRPEAAIASISSGVLRMIATSELLFEAEGGKRGPDVAVHLVGRAGAVEAAQQPLLLVVVDQRLGLLVEDVEPVLDRLLLVVVALDQRRAVLVAEARGSSAGRTPGGRRGRSSCTRAGPRGGGSPPRRAASIEQHGGQAPAEARRAPARARRPGGSCAGSRRAGSRRAASALSIRSTITPADQRRRAPGRPGPCTPWPPCPARVPSFTAARRMSPVA